MNPLTWSRPLQIVAGLGVAFVLYMLISGLGGIVWARHVAGVALKGIARTISDYDRVEADGKANEQAVSALARQTQELEKQAAAERASRVEMAKQLDVVTKRASASEAEVRRLKIEDANRPRITTLDAAVVAINKALKR